MSLAPQDDIDAEAEACSKPQPGLRAASLSALEEALRRALEVASREQVLQRVADSLPLASKGRPKAGLHGKVEKVSVSMPAELTTAVKARTGAGGFSRYVSDAVQERIRLDLLDDLSKELAAEFGPIDDDLVRQAMAEWPDYSRE